MSSNRAVLEEMKREATSLLEEARHQALKFWKRTGIVKTGWVASPYEGELESIYFSKSGHTVHRNRYAMAVYKIAFEMAQGQPFDVAYTLYQMAEDMKDNLEDHSGEEVVEIPFEYSSWFTGE